MSATETPLGTTDALNKILTEENSRLTIDNADLRMREQVGKEAFDKMRAELEKAREQLAHVIETNETEAAIDAEEKRKLRADLAERDALRAQLAEKEEEVKQWKANHDNQVELRRALMDRPDLGGRAKSMQTLIARAESAEARVRELEQTNAGLWSDAVEAKRLLRERENELAGQVNKAEARLAAVLGAADAALAVGWRAGITCSANVCTDHSNRLNADDEDLALVRQASDLGRQIARWLEPTAQTMEELRGILDAARTGDAAHPDSVKLAAVIRGLTAVEALIGDSFGVAGLHLNGDVAPWAELRSGGRYERWLVDFDAALDAAKSGAGVDVVTRSELIAMLGDLAKLRCHVLRYGPAGYDLYSSMEVAALLEDKARPQFYTFADDEMSTECPEEWLDCACYSDGVHVVAADAFRRLPKRYFVWVVNQEAAKREDRQKILIETADKAEAERVAEAARKEGSE